VLALDLDGRRARLGSGDTLGFDTVVLATGASPRRLGIPGSRLDGVHYLRTVDDAVRLRDAIRTADRVAVIGAGWIGSEVTASARQLGTDVVLIDPAPTPLHRVLGTEVGAVFRRVHADHGVDLRLGVGVSELQGNGSVQKVVLTDGRVEPADVVVVAVGVLPRVELATAAGLAVSDGVVVDDRLRANVPGVYAAGDVANAWHPRYRRHLRVEHWATAFDQGTAAGANAAGREEPYTRLPSFYSEQYDLGLAYVGHADPGDRFSVRGRLTEHRFIGFFHRDGLVSAAIAVNMWESVDDLKALVDAGRPIDPCRLQDEGVPVTELTAELPAERG
jgi:3-phenylpropionate/trans-cinnamate dioxygenase ferredoxin reductase subunit